MENKEKSTYVGNNAVENTPSITKSVLPSRQLTEVLRGLGYNVVI